MRIVTALLFFIWILPLGIFIGSSKEKLACDGQRAICLCHKITFMAPDKPMEPGVSLKTAAASSHKEEGHSGGGGQYFVSASSKDGRDLRLGSLFEEQYLNYKNPHLASLEHVPKVCILS